MKAIFLTALIAVCSSAKLDRTYLPPASAKTAGGSSDILQPPVTKNQGLGGLPVGSFENAYQGIVVDAAVGIRATSPGQSGLGAPRITYGSTDSKVGEAAFRDKHLQGGASFLPQGFTDQFHSPERVQATRDRISNTIRLETNIRPEGYNYIYETDNGISARENGVSVNGVKAQGGYSYTGDDGQVYTVTYTADEDGYKPQGAHLPTPPPIPAEILESLEQNAKDEAAGLVDDGSYDAKKYNTGGDYSDNSDNDRFNDRQSNKFVNRPGSSTQTGGSYINQNNQVLRPNTNTQSGFISSINEGQLNLQSTVIPSSSAGLELQSKPEISNNLGQTQDLFGIKPTDISSQSSSVLSNKFGQNTFEERPVNKEYLPPIGQHNILTQKFDRPVSENKTVIPTQEISIPLSQQSLQNLGNHQNTLSQSRPSSYEISSIGQVQPTQSFGSNAQKEINTPIQENMPQPNTDSNMFTGLGNSQNSFGSTFPQPTQTLSTFNNNGNIALSSNPINTPSSSFANQPTLIPTSQPSRELTTPFDVKPPINLNNDRKSTSPVSPLTTSEANYNLQNSNLQETKDKKFSNKPQSTSGQGTLINRPTNYAGAIYQYNKPSLVIKNDSRSENFAQKPTFGPRPVLVDSQNINTRPQSIGQQSSATNMPINTYEGEIYQYNKPSPSPHTSNPQLFTQQPVSEGSTQKLILSNKPTSFNSKGEIYQYNKPVDSQITDASPQDITLRPILQGFQPTTSNNGELYQYNKPSSLPNSNIQKTSNIVNSPLTLQAHNFNQFNQAPTTAESFIAQGPSSQIPTAQGFQGSFLEPRPTDASIFSNSPSYNQYSQSPGSLNSPAFFYQQTGLENKRPLENYFLQIQPTMPSFSQTNTNQYNQPQGADGSYYYDKPSIQFQQQFNQNKITQRPQFVDQTQTFTSSNAELTKPSSQLSESSVQSPNQFQNINREITQISPSSFGSIIPTPVQQIPNQPFRPNSQSSQPINLQTGPASFAQAFITTQSFSSLKPQGQTAIVVQSPSENTEGEIYQYNKPVESLPTTQHEANEDEKKTASLNGQLNPQSINGLDKQGSVNMIDFTPASTLTQGMNLNQNFNTAQQGQQTPETSAPFKPDQSITTLEQPSSRPLGSTILGSPCCKGPFNRKQFNVQSTIKSEQSSPKPIGEQFDVNRKPATFDSTGYHY